MVCNVFESAKRMGRIGQLLAILIVSLNSIALNRLLAQSYKTLHSFTRSVNLLNADGANPFAGVALADNVLFGTTQYGGALGSGTLFKLNIDGTGFKVLHDFDYRNEGSFPRSRLAVSNNVVYGTTWLYGSSGTGSVFKVNSDGSGFAVLHRFSPTPYGTNADGASPFGPVLLADDTLYGTTEYGGSFGHGIVFKVQTNGTAFTNLHSFTGDTNYFIVTNTDGAYPDGGLVLSGSMLYGTAYGGGGRGIGTVFKINTDGTGFTTLHSFSGMDGNGPIAGVILVGATLYGTTYGGGLGAGTVFSVNTNGSDFQVLHAFSRGSNGGDIPYGGLVYCGDTLFGTTSDPAGGVFALNTNGTNFRVIYALGYNSDGSSPFDGLAMSDDTLYGTTAGGGEWGAGTVFMVLVRPHLVIASAGENVVLTWPTNATSFTLQSATNPSSAAVWFTNLPPPVIVNGRNTVITPVFSQQQFFRLGQ